MKTLYAMPNTRSFRALWALEEVGTDYDYRLVNLGRGEGQTEAFLALNPAGKLPVLQDGPLVLSESAAICTYLADGAPELGLAPPPKSSERGRYNQWCFFVLSELEQPLWTIGKHKFALPKEYRVREVLPTAVFEFERAARLLAKGLEERDFLVGDQFTMADLLATHTLIWAQMLKIKHGFERLDLYLRQQQGREAFKRASRIEQEQKGQMA